MGVNCWPLNKKGKTFFNLLRLAGRGETQFLSEFTALFSQLRSAEIDLQDASVTLETQFLATSSELETLTQFGDRFVQQVEKLIILATGRDCHGSVFSKAIHLIERSTQFLVECQEETTRMLGLLRNCSVQIDNLLKIESDLERTMLPLKFVQTLFKMESAPLGEGVQQTFTALTQEIEGLHGQLREIFGTQFKQLEETRRVIEKVIVQLERQAQSLRQVITTHKAQIDSSLEMLKQEIISNQDRDARLGTLSKALAREVEQVVMGLQFQDIVHQKTEHVRAALPEIETKFTEFEASPKTAGRDSLQFLRQSSLLEAEQLQAAQAELARAERVIQEGVRKVLGHLSEMDSHCLSLDEFKLLTTSFDGMVQVLVEMIEEVRSLVAETVASASEAYEMLRPLGSLASDLTARLRAVSSQTHLIGLNAQVQAAAGALDRRGAGLEVLSAWTTRISDETNLASRDAAEELEQLAAVLADNVRALGQLKANGVAHQTSLGQEGQSEERQLHAFRDTALETLRAIGDSLDGIQAQAQRTLDTVEFTTFHQETIPALRAPLIAIAAAAERWLQKHGVGLAQASLIDGSARNYTMASERVVFEGVVAAQRLANPTPTEVKQIPGENIEMFADSSAVAGVEVPQPAEPDRNATLVTANTSPAANEFGANVELF